MNKIKSNLSFAFFLSLLSITNVFAGQMGGVFGPSISPTDRSWQYRYANAFGENGRDDNWASRLHYQHALSDSTRIRGVIQYRDNQDDLHFDQARLEYQWQFQDGKKTNSKWDSALRFDAVMRGGRGPEEIGMHWTNQWRLNEQWNAKAVFMSFLQLGSDRANGIVLLSRYSLSYKLADKTTLSLESFNTHGSTADIADFNDTPHELGIALSGSFGPLGYRLSYLKGITDSAPDDTVGLWVTYKL